MKQKLLPLLLVPTMLLSACGLQLPGGTQEPAVSVEPEVGSAEIQVYGIEDPGVSGEEQTVTPEEPEATPVSEEAPVTTPPAVIEPILQQTDNTAVRDLELVRVLSYMPDLKVDLRYASENNFTGKVVYSIDEPYLRYGTVKKLKDAQSRLKELGYELLLWDAFRPVEAQFILFDAHPNGFDVANPYGGGHSAHSSGGTVDVALMKNGALVELPSDLDDFTGLGDTNYGDVSAEAAANAKLLAEVMTAAGFTGYNREWWHFSDNTGYNYTDVEGAVLPERATGVYESVCKEYINIRRVANTTAEAIGNIPNGERMAVLSYLSGFAHVQYGETTGYVNSYFIRPVYN